MSIVSTHSRPKAADPPMFVPAEAFAVVSTHSRPKAAGRRLTGLSVPIRCFNTQPPEGGWPTEKGAKIWHWFQHTAARRRLHSNVRFAHTLRCFNTQPPEGGCWVISTPDIS